MIEEKPDTLVTAGEWFRREEDCFCREHYVEAVRCYLLAADHNQSIYGAGLSWAQVTDELSFTGKSRILQNNYRTTVEMWNGLQQLFPSNKQLDEETSESRAQRHGAMPIVSYYGDETSQIE